MPGLHLLDADEVQGDRVDQAQVEPMVDHQEPLAEPGREVLDQPRELGALALARLEQLLELAQQRQWLGSASGAELFEQLRMGPAEPLPDHPDDERDRQHPEQDQQRRRRSGELGDQEQGQGGDCGDQEQTGNGHGKPRKR